MFDLSIIIVNYNTKRLLQDCLDSIIKNYSTQLNNHSFEIIVIDNASRDGSIEMLREYANKRKFLTIIANKDNLGFSKANNISIRQAKGKYLLFLNSDTIVNQPTLITLIEFMNNNLDAGAVTSKVLLPNGEIDDASHRGFPTPWNSFCHFSGLAKLLPKIKLFSGYNLTWMDLNTIHQIDACAGAMMLVRKEAGEQIGWWDEDYFFYGEDLDFCYMLKQTEWKIYYLPQVSILHFKGASGGIKKISHHLTSADKTRKIMVTNARFQAMEIFYKKHYLDKYSKLVTALVFWGIALKKWVTLRSLK